MKGVLAFIVSVALMAQLCESSYSSHEEERQAPTHRPGWSYKSAPAYLDVPRFRDCLVGPHDLYMCIPPKKPAKCPTASWRKFVPDDDLEKCP
jgi:hypothetical protein